MDAERKKHWLSRDAWEGWQAASMLHGHDPIDDFNTDFAVTLQLLSDAAVMGNLAETEKRSHDLDLNFILYANYNKLYDPKEIIKWATNKDFPDFPFTLTDIGVTENPGGNDEKPLTTNEKNTLLVIIAALLKEQKTDPSAKGAAAYIKKLTEDIGAPISEDTALEKLRQIPDALERRKK